MQGGIEPSPAADRSRAALDCLHGLLSAERPPALAVWLGGLAKALAAGAAGAAALGDGAAQVLHRVAADGQFLGPVASPWQGRPDLLDRVRRDGVAEAPGGNGGSWLLAAGEGWLLWAERAAAWSTAERAAFALAAPALARRADEETAGGLRRYRAARQRRLEDAALVARRLAHDFGNVLTGVMGFSELTLAQLPANSPLHGYVTEAYRGAQQGARLTQRLRLFSRRSPTHPVPTALPLVVPAEEARLRPELGPDVLLRFDVPDDLPPVAIDAELLRQVLAELLDNAREAVGARGRIELTARAAELSEADCFDLFGAPAPGPHVEVRVADDAAGLSDDARRRLFAEPFYSTKPRHRGLGLAVVYGIVHAHRGGVRVSAASPQGTVAQVFLPAAGAAPRAEPASGASAGRGERVLVVDDEPAILEVVRATLRQSGYRAETACGADEALVSYAAAAGDPYRLVVSDVIMPRTNGVELVRALLRRDPKVNVLFMSGQVSADFAQEDFARWNFELLTKPFRSEGLLRAVRAALDRGARLALPDGQGPGENPVLASSR